MMNNKTGLAIFIACLIIAVVLFFLGYQYVALGVVAVGIVLYFVVPKNNAEEVEQEEVREDVPEEKVDEVMITSLLDNLFRSINEFHGQEYKCVFDLLKAQEEILKNLEELNEYEPALLAKIYPTFHSKLASLSTNWIKIKEDYKEIDPKLLMATLDRGYEDLVNTTKVPFEQVEDYFTKVANCNQLPNEVKEYAKEKFDLYETSQKGISSEVSGEPVVNFEQIKAPTEVMDLSWYKDGPLANFPKTDVDVKIEQDHFTFTLQMNNQEPSLISVCDEVAAVNNCNVKLESPLNYSAMTSQERGAYLYWLNNMSAEDGEDYAKLFAMSVERYVFLKEEPEKAFNMLVQLHGLFANNREWNSYLTNLMVTCALINESKEMASKLLDLSGNRIPNTVLAVANILGVPLAIDHIYALAPSVGFTNKRYIKLYPDMFTDVLRQMLYKNYSMEKFPLKESYLSKAQETIEVATNTSAEVAVLTMDTMEINEELKKTLYDLLKDTHENIKETLKEQRKNKSKNS